MALTQTDKNEIEVMIRKEIKSFLDSNTSKQFEDKLIDKISIEIQRGKLKKEVKDIIIKSFQEYFNMMYHQKSYWESKKEAKNITEKEEIKNTLDNILTTFKTYGKDNPEIALKNLQSYCSDSNIIKTKDVFKLKELFADGKYGILLGKFDRYYVTNYNKIYDTEVNETYYEVDVKIEAPYNTMIYNSIQFDEMYYPEISGDPCYIYYRWIFVKKTDKYMLDGCYLLHKNIE